MVSSMGTQRHRARRPDAPVPGGQGGRRRRALEASGLRWTIVQPGPPHERPRDGHRRPRAGARPRRARSPRDDVALVLYHCLLADNTIGARSSSCFDGPDARRGRRAGAQPGSTALAWADARPPRRGPVAVLRARRACPGRRSRRAPPATRSTRRPRRCPRARTARRSGQRKLTGKAELKSAKSNRLLLYRSTADERHDDRRLRHGRGPEGQGAEGRLAGDQLGARHDRHRRRLRADHASACPRSYDQHAAQPLAEGRLRGRAHRLRGPRHARRRTRT